VARAPFYDADHRGDFIVVVDADLGMGIVWGAAGAQECDVLLKLGQGRTAGKGPLVLACIFVLGSHGDHLRGMARAREPGPPDRERVAEPYWWPHDAPRGGAWAGPKGPAKDLMLISSRSARA